MADHYPYRIRTRSGELLLIWQPAADGGSCDTLAVGEDGRLLAFGTDEALLAYCGRTGTELVLEGEGTLDLAAVRRWAQRPSLRAATPGQLLDAWNFFEDLARSLPAGPALPVQGPAHDRAYDKLFGGEALDPDGGEESWTEQETGLVRELLHAGAVLWDHAVAGAGLR